MAEDWLEKHEQAIDLFRTRGKGAEAARLLEIGSVNRTIISSRQAILCIAARTLSMVMRSRYNEKSVGKKWLWPAQIADWVEEYQQTMQGETNSRIQFSKVAIAQFQGIINKAKSELEKMVS
jgi:hypothetical protein